MKNAFFPLARSKQYGNNQSPGHLSTQQESQFPSNKALRRCLEVRSEEKFTSEQAALPVVQMASNSDNLKWQESAGPSFRWKYEECGDKTHYDAHTKWVIFNSLISEFDQRGFD